MFWQKYVELCEKNNVKPRAVAKEFNAAPATVTRWKNGSVPNKEMLEKIAEKFNVTVDYLINDEEISLNMNDKRSSFKKLTAVPQRWMSLHSGSDIAKQDFIYISEYVNASLYYLNSDKCLEYVPENAEYDKKRLLNIEVLFTILNIMDACADTDFYRTLQIQLSRIVLYHLANKGFTQEKLSECARLSSDKLDFLCNGTEKADVTLNYGLNYSDLSSLYDFTKLSYQYMFTGVEGKFSDIVTDIMKQ